MSNKVTVAAIQMTYGLEEACEKVREAASQGAQIILLPELFENWYFCQEKSYENYHLATTLEENPAVREMQTIARDFKVVIPVSYYERVGETTFNTVAVIDADGTIMGQYRKTHIPDDHFYQEKFYFTPGNTGFKVWDTAYAKIGVGICWDHVGGKYFVVTDAKTLDAYTADKLPFEVSGAGPANPTGKGDFRALAEEAVKQGVGFKADTLEELAKMAGFESDFTKQVADYNKAVETKKDPFGKPAEFLQFGVKEGPFYAFRAKVVSLSTLGGLRVGPDWDGWHSKHGN